GPRRTMLLGSVLYILGTIGFVGYGINVLDYPVMLLTYAIRGFGYPLFAYSFLVWITYNSPQEKLGRAVGWFWFVFTGGLNVLGAYYSTWAISSLGYIDTLWSAIFWIALGTALALLLTSKKMNIVVPKDRGGKLEELQKGLTIIREEPKVLMGGIVRIINTTAQFAFPVFLPTYMALYGLDTVEWLQIWGTIFTSNINFNLIFGFVGDKMRWRKTVMWFGGVGCAVSTLIFFYSPLLFVDSFRMVMVGGVNLCALRAGYLPLSILVPALVNEDTGEVMALLNLGAGLAVFVGPLIVCTLFEAVGNEGLSWLLAGLCLLIA